jgi:hypothetical protein
MRVALIIGNGGDNARHADLLADWIGQADSLDDRRVLYIRDRDELSEGTLRKLESSPCVHVLKRRELENYFLDSGAIAQHLQATSGVETTEDEVARTITEASVSLINAAVIGRVCWQLPPVRLADNKFRRTMRSSNVDLATLLRHVQSVIPSKADLEAKITQVWNEADTDLRAQDPADLVHIVGGSDILEIVFKKIAERRYDKRRDGQALARLITPPTELTDLVSSFLSEEKAPEA